MKMEQSFTVAAPVEEVWDALVDVERIAPCLPGANIHDKSDDGTYHGTFTVKLGPTTASYNGTLKMESLDEAARAATMSAKGTDKRGQGGASATIVSTMKQEGDETRVDVVTDFTITGRLARFGRGGMIQDISNRLMRDFATCLQSTIVQEQPAAPAPEPAGAAPGGSVPAGGERTATAADTAAAAEAAPVAARQAPVQPAKPVNAISLFFAALWDRIRRLFRRA